MRTIIIEFNGPEGALDVVDYHGRRCGGLTLGETLEQIISIHISGTERYEMITNEERERRSRERSSRISTTTTGNTL